MYTFFSLVVIIVGLFLQMFFLIPKIYESYEKERLVKYADQFSGEVSKYLSNNFKENNFENNTLEITFLNDINVYFTYKDKPYYLFTQDGNAETTTAEIVPFTMDFKKYDELGELVETRVQQYEGSEIKFFFIPKKENINGVRHSILLAFPYIIMLTIFISIVFAVAFSQMISRPVVTLSKKAKAIEKLNFENKYIVDSEDELGQLSGSLENMSEKLEKYIAELSDDVARAEAKEREQRMTMSIMTHELKTPLTVLKGHTDCMLKNIGDYANREKYLAQNIETIERMERLVEDILTSARLDTINNNLRRQHFEVKSFIEKVLVDTELQQQEKKLTLNVNINETWLYVDETLIERAVKNIIENAIKYSEEGTKVTISLVNHKLRVTNTNNEINENDLMLLFKPFYRLDDSRNSKSGGHGIGLYIVKKTLESHNFDYKMHLDGNMVIFDVNFSENFIK
ncbi:MAG: sensor histidine kinase [Mycoplasmatales bacterium]